MGKVILKYILFEDLKNKDLTLFRKIMSILGTFIFLTILPSFIHSGAKFHYSLGLLCCPFFITLLLYRKKITKEVAIRIAIGFFSTFSNTLLSLLIFFIFLLLDFLIMPFEFSINSDVYNFISSIIRFGEKYIIGLFFFMQYFLLLYTVHKLTKER